MMNEPKLHSIRSKVRRCRNNGNWPRQRCADLRHSSRQFSLISINSFPIHHTPQETQTNCQLWRNKQIAQLLSTNYSYMKCSFSGNATPRLPRPLRPSGGAGGGRRTGGLLKLKTYVQVKFSSPEGLAGHCDSGHRRVQPRPRRLIGGNQD